MGTAGATDRSLASTALTAPARSSRRRAGYSDPNDTPLPNPTMPKGRGQPLLELVAVELLVLEEPQDGQFQHDRVTIARVPMYRVDISSRKPSFFSVRQAARAVGCDA